MFTIIATQFAVFRLAAAAAFIVCLTVFVSGCGYHHSSIVGKWMHPLGTNGKSGMVYEFHTDGTLIHYSQVDVRAQLPGTGVMLSPKFIGMYTFNNGLLAYHTTSVQAQDGTASLGRVRMPDEQYRAVLAGDKLKLSRSGGPYEGPVEEFTRQ